MISNTLASNTLSFGYKVLQPPRTLVAHSQQALRGAPGDVRLPPPEQAGPDHLKLCRVANDHDRDHILGLYCRQQSIPINFLLDLPQQHDRDIVGRPEF